ncbi:MAG: hypothetical protein RMJ55_17035 [Roseiflexaceae bacterium]|nr:hypothetical protein [Roseiflexaceae bacterium]
MAPHDAAARQAWQQRGGVPATPQELNRYAYARNNPLRYTDPTGHHPCVALLAGGPVGAGVAASCALFFLGVAAVGYFTGEAIRHAVEEGQGLPPPLSSDTGGQLASPNPDPDPESDDRQCVVTTEYEAARAANYRGTYFAANPALRPFARDIVVHHRVPLETLMKRPGLFTSEELNAAHNLRGIPTQLNRTLHLSEIHGSRWAEFWRIHPNATREQVLRFAQQLDDEYNLSNLARDFFLSNP